jgi:hypothetical protein
LDAFFIPEYVGQFYGLFPSNEKDKGKLMIIVELNRKKEGGEDEGM